MKTTAVYNREELLNVDLEITMSATMKEWIHLSTQLSSKDWPSFDLKTQITEAVRLGQQVFEVNTENPG